jgi:hypothetical protein
MKRKTLNPNRAIPVTLLGLLILATTLFLGRLAHISTDYPVRLTHEIVPGLQREEVEPVPAEQSSLTTPIASTDVIGEMLQQVSRDRALNDLRKLTGEAPICVDTACYTITNRRTGSVGLDWAMRYLQDTLVALGYAVETQAWSHSGYADRNLIAEKMGVVTPTEEIYLVAHVDGVGGSEASYPAADDNASSVVNGLELARIFSNHRFGRTIVLFFSTGEEQGAQGVRHYLAQLSPSDLGAIKYVINCDMIGYDANHDGVMELVHGGHLPSLALAQVISDTIDTYGLDLNQRTIVGCP